MTLYRVHWNQFQTYGNRYCYVFDERSVEKFTNITKFVLRAADNCGVYGVGSQRRVSLHPFYLVAGLRNAQ